MSVGAAIEEEGVLEEGESSFVGLTVEIAVVADHHDVDMVGC